MKKLIAATACMGLISGCATTDWSKPVFPAVPPPKPEPVAKASRADGIKTRADVEKKDAPVKTESASKTEPARQRGPVTATQVTDRNAQEILKALEAELDQETTKPASKP